MAKAIYKVCLGCGRYGKGIKVFPPQKNCNGLCVDCWKEWKPRKKELTRTLVRFCGDCGRYFKRESKTKKICVECRKKRDGSVKYCCGCGARVKSHNITGLCAKCLQPVYEKRAIKRRADQLSIPVLYWSGSEWKKKDRCDWCTQIGRELARHRSVVSLRRMKNENNWQYAIGYRLNANRDRKPKRDSTVPAGYGCSGAIRAIKRKRWLLNNPWHSMIGNRLSGIRKRRNRLAVRSNRNDSGSVRQARSKPVQVCFDWLGTSA